MNTLTIDTTERDAGCALFSASGLVGEVRVEASGSAETLTAMIEELLGSAGVSLQEISRIVVGLGPGSFTGLRSGIATAQGLACVLGCPVFGVSTLFAGALVAAQTSVSVVTHMHAAKGQRFASAFSFRSDGAGLEYGVHSTVQVVDESEVDAFAASVASGGRVKVISIDPEIGLPSRSVLFGRAVLQFADRADTDGVLVRRDKGIGLEAAYAKGASALTLAERGVLQPWQTS